MKIDLRHLVKCLLGKFIEVRGVTHRPLIFFYKSTFYNINRENAVAYSSAYFGAGTGQIWLDDLSCTGTETDIADCPNITWGYHNCWHGEDAGVACSGNIMMYDFWFLGMNNVGIRVILVPRNE